MITFLVATFIALDLFSLGLPKLLKVLKWVSIGPIFYMTMMSLGMTAVILLVSKLILEDKYLLAAFASIFIFVFNELKRRLRESTERLVNSFRKFDECVSKFDQDE